MARLKHSLIAAAGVLALVSVVTVSDRRRALAQLPTQILPVPVKVTNTPLPVHSVNASRVPSGNDLRGGLL